MNSLMQQFYTTPHFAETLLAIEPPELENKDKKEDVMDGDILMFEELKTLMTSLNQTQLKAHNPSNFCQSFKDFEGNSIDVRIQQGLRIFEKNIQFLFIF